MEVLKEPYETDKVIRILLQERARLISAFRDLPICEGIYPTDANFFLAKMTDAQKIYDYLVNKGIIVRNRTRISLCNNCLRITIGTKTENAELLSALRQY
jgi:histidinol-phosphate aminotransferase